MIAQGVAPVPGGDIARRLVEDTAEEAGAAGFEERALGFAIATGDALLLTDEVTGARTRLARDEAAFTSEGIVQRRESLGDASTSYLRIGLVPAAEASNPNGDTLVFAGDGFAAPAGDREIELIAAKLEDGESTAVRATNAALVIVLSGSLTVGDDHLATGDATVLNGTIDIEASDDGTRVLIAVIGAEVPAAASAPAADASASPVATQVPTSNDASASASKIHILTELCPAGVTIEQAQDTSAGDPCFGSGAVADMLVTITNLETGDSFSSGVDPANSTAAFLGLPSGLYQVVLDSGPELGHSVGICGGQDGSDDLPLVEINASVVNLDLPEDREYLCASHTVQLGDKAGSGGAEEHAANGTFAATFYACPASMTFATLDPTQCTLVTEGFDYGLQGESDLHLADAFFDGSSYVWDGLIVSPDVATGYSSSHTAFAYPSGNNWFAFSVDGGEIREPAAGGFVFTPDRQSNSVEVYFISH